MGPDYSGPKSILELDGRSPEKIYAYVTDGVRDVIRALEAQAEDTEDAAVRIEIIAGLNLMQAQIAGKQEELRASADWKDFTVALYGETNAGKSTIIESLRIHLGESSKLEQRHRFDKLKATLGLDDEALQAIRDEIELARAAAIEASLRGKQLNLEGQGQLQTLEQEKTRRDEQALIARANRSWLKRLLGLFRRAEEDVTCQEIQARIIELRNHQLQERQQVSAEVSSAKAALASAEDTLARRMREMPRLLEHADGGIIGDGRPDFTLATQCYSFNIVGYPFVLLDVPGIEGGEESVKAHIDKAVQTAHAVFYVTGKAARPQHGDKEEGTLEKIKRHLGPQTEVWAIFNKRVTAPVSLRKAGSLFAHDADGMADLEQGLRETLGPNYRGVLPVSAYPAFLALADRLPPAAALADTQQGGQDRKAARAKFLSEFDAETILDRTGLAALANHLISMAIDAPRKIQHSNVYKANQSLQKFVRELNHHAATMESHAKKVTAETTAIRGQVDRAALKLGSSLRTDAGDSLRALKAGVRKEIYALIEVGINTEKLKSELQSSLERHVSDMQRDVDKKFKESVTQFQSAVNKAAERFQKHLKDLGEIAGAQMRDFSGPSFNLDLRVNNGVNIAGLVTTAVGAIILALTGPAGWVVISLSVVGVILSLAKALWSLVDEDFRKSQQRKAVDENLFKVAASLKKDLEASEKVVVEAVESASAEAKKRLGGPQRNVKSQSAILRLSANRLSALSIKIETTMT
jgi:gas vesicle protein